ncbi:caspase family protein [Desulfobacterales bacterium HSG16]|nr:caspase family protein [Desulfobacterales bacterium HSG16]
MARRALLVGINDYRSIQDLRGCLSDVENIRHVLKTCLGFRNNDIRAVMDSRATKNGILKRLHYMADTAQAGDYLFFHFSGHGSQVRDRDGDELNDHMDELLCPWDMDWDGTYILDDDLEDVFKKIPDGVNFEVIMDCCHSGWDTGATAPVGGTRDIRFTPPDPGAGERDIVSRYLNPPRDIIARHEGEEDFMSASRSFSESDNRSTSKHVLWAGCLPTQTSADAFIDGDYHGAFTYHFCMHMRQARGNISRAVLLERIRESLRNKGYSQLPQLACSPEAAQKRPLQFPNLPEEHRLLFLTQPNMRGNDVMEMQGALRKAGYDMEPDGCFGPYTRIVVMKFQRRNGLLEDGIVGPAVLAAITGK